MKAGIEALRAAVAAGAAAGLLAAAAAHGLVAAAGDPRGGADAAPRQLGDDPLDRPARQRLDDRRN